MIPAAVADSPGVDVHVGGQAAMWIDMSERVESRLPWFIGGVLLLSVALLKLLGDRNWWLPGRLDRRLPNLDVEGGVGCRRPTTSPAAGRPSPACPVRPAPAGRPWSTNLMGVAGGGLCGVVAGQPDRRPSRPAGTDPAGDLVCDRPARVVASGP